MAAASGLKVLWLTWLSKPEGDRALYRLIRKRRPRKMLELGLSDVTRTQRMISLALRYQSAEEIQYVGVDRFEARPQGLPSLPLKEAHKLLRTTGVKVSLVPGDPLEALARAANALRDIELVVISADQPQQSLDQAWFYLPRTLAADAVLLCEELGSDRAETRILKPFSRLELQRRAAAATPRRHAA